MNRSDILDKIDTYCTNHPLRIVKDNIEHPFPNSYLNYLINALMKLNLFSKKATRDFLDNKLMAKNGDTCDQHKVLSSLCELTVLNSFLDKLDNRNDFMYEPVVRRDSNKNPECYVKIKDVNYYIEVKAPNFENYNKKLYKLLEKKRQALHFESRIFELDSEMKKNNLTSTDSKVKDFLSDTNKKFARVEAQNNINILFICWNDHTDQPATALKHFNNGLLTNQSWYREEGEIVTFDNIDIIFINDIYQSHFIHMSCKDEPLSNYISGVPYFDVTFETGFIPNPFLIKNSRSWIIETNVGEDKIFPLPISTYDKPIKIIDEEYVKKHCPDVKSTVKL